LEGYPYVETIEEGIVSIDPVDEYIYGSENKSQRRVEHPRGTWQSLYPLCETVKPGW
jgi:hypothetical protein